MGCKKVLRYVFYSDWYSLNTIKLSFYRDVQLLLDNASHHSCRRGVTLLVSSRMQLNATNVLNRNFTCCHIVKPVSRRCAAVADAHVYNENCATVAVYSTDLTQKHVYYLPYVEGDPRQVQELVDIYHHQQGEACTFLCWYTLLSIIIPIRRKLSTKQEFFRTKLYLLLVA